jgi:type II secretory pathway pseudopilin PulG
MRGTPVARHHRGFTYLGLLILLAIMGLVSATTLRVGTLMQRRVAEQELLEKGLALTRALESYAQATKPGQSPAPRSIEDLLRDPRSPRALVRHLRHMEIDPMTGRSDWAVVLGPDGRSIIGFHSLSEEKAVKTDDFPPPFDDFDGKLYYKEWLFVVGLGD